jgi:hypothetical protein
MSEGVFVRDTSAFTPKHHIYKHTHTHTLRGQEGLSGVILLDDFVEVMIARHKGQELSDDELKEAFSVFDVDDIGFINAKDVRAVLLLLLDLQTDPGEIDDMFQATTKDPQGRVTFEEFRDIIRWKPPTTKIDRAEQEDLCALLLRAAISESLPLESLAISESLLLESLLRESLLLPRAAISELTQ